MLHHHEPCSFSSSVGHRLYALSLCWIPKTKHWIFCHHVFHHNLSSDSWHTSVKTFLNKRPAAISGQAVSQETLPWKQMLCTAHSTPAADFPRAMKESVLQLEDLGSSLSPSESPPGPAEGPSCKTLNSYQLPGRCSVSRVQAWPLTRLWRAGPTRSLSETRRESRKTFSAEHFINILDF